MIPELRTERLLLRPVTLADTEQTQTLFPQWKIVRFLAASVPWPYPQDGALCYIRDMVLPGMARGNEWYWTLRLKGEAQTMVGIISLMANERDNRGFWLGLPWHGRGLMSEAVDAVTAFWFETLGQPVLRVQKAAANEVSRRISARQGMRPVDKFLKDFVSGRLPAEMWEMTAEEWRHARSPATAPLP